MPIISASLAPQVREALDAEAKRQGRPRSFVVSEAIQQYVAGPRDAQFVAARQQLWRRHLRQSPEERVRELERLTDELTRGRKRPKPAARSFQTFRERDAWLAERHRRIR